MKWTQNNLKFLIKIQIPTMNKKNVWPNLTNMNKMFDHQ